MDVKPPPGDINSAIQEVSSNQWLCLYCQKICSTKGNARLHFRVVHLKEKKHKCDKCGKKFGQKSDVTKHLRTCNKN